MFTSFRNGVVSLSCFPLQIRWWFRQIECSTILADGLWNSHLLSTSSYSFDCGILGDQEWEDPWECQVVKVLCRLPWSWSTFCPKTCHCNSYWNFPEWSLSKVPTIRRFFPKKVALKILLTHFLRRKILKNDILPKKFQIFNLLHIEQPSWIF